MPYLMNGLVVLLTASIIGLVNAQLNLRHELAQFKLEVAKGYPDFGDFARVEKAIGNIEQELRSLVEIMAAMRSDLRYSTIYARDKDRRSADGEGYVP